MRSWLEKVDPRLAGMQAWHGRTIREFIRGSRNGDVGTSIGASPCVGCGDKTNAAEVKASPAAQEKLLAGD